MFDLSISEMLVIAVLILVVFDAEQLPELMRKAGRLYGHIRSASDDLRRAFNAEVARVDAEKRREEMLRRREEIQARLRAQPRPEEDTAPPVGRPDRAAPGPADRAAATDGAGAADTAPDRAAPPPAPLDTAPATNDTPATKDAPAPGAGGEEGAR